jgi:hypothetical protein
LLQLNEDVVEDVNDLEVKLLTNSFLPSSVTVRVWDQIEIEMRTTDKGGVRDIGGERDGVRERGGERGEEKESEEETPHSTRSRVSWI